MDEAAGDTEEARKLAITSPTGTLRNVRIHGDRGSSHLAREAEALVSRKRTSHLMDVDHQLERIPRKPQ
jgi:hypothetical protein